MPSIAYAVPSGTTYREGARVGFTRPGLSVSQFPTGPYLSRDLLGHNLRTYELTPSIFDGSSTSQLEAWERFLHRTNGGGDPFWIMEPISKRHDFVVCGPPLDGSTKTFTLPVQDATINGWVDVGDFARSSYTKYNRANLLGTDAIATCSDASYWNASGATVAVGTDIAIIGTSSLLMTPDGVTAYPSLNLGSSYRPTVTAGKEYTALAWVNPRNSTDFRVNIAWYSSAPAYLSTSNGTTTALTSGAWQALDVTATAPASAATAQVIVERREAAPNTFTFYVGAAAIAPGSLDVWHLPSMAPGVIVLGSAYSSTGDGRVKLSATGKRVTRCVGQPGMSWTLDGRGSASVRSLTATEALEF